VNSVTKVIVAVLSIVCTGNPGQGDAADLADQHQQASGQAVQRNDLDTAETEARQALEEAERSYGRDDPRTGQMSMWLAAVYRVRGRNEEAQRAAERGLGISEKTFGPDHVETAAAMSMLAVLYADAGDVAKAESLLRRSVTIKERGFGPDHPYTAVASSSLADILAGQGKYDEAEQLNQRALAALEKAWSPDNPSVPLALRLNTPTTMEGLASVNIGQGRIKEAEVLLTRAAQLRIAMVGGEHLSLVGNRTILGQAYQAGGKSADAERTYREGLRIAEKTFGNESRVVSNILALLADSCLAQGQHDTAAEFYGRSVAIDEKVLPAGHPQRVKHLQGYTNLLKATGHAKEAGEIGLPAPEGH